MFLTHTSQYHNTQRKHKFSQIIIYKKKITEIIVNENINLLKQQ